jgi:hypothetical protein
MRRTGWRNDSWRHSLAARGIPTGKRRYNKGKIAKFLTSDGRAETADFAAEMKLREVETVREDAFQELRAAEERGDISFSQAQDFFERDFKDEVKDFLDNKRTAEQFRAGVKTKIMRVTQPVQVMGVSNRE